jgi:hypothetical protein
MLVLNAGTSSSVFVGRNIGSKGFPVVSMLGSCISGVAGFGGSVYGLLLSSLVIIFLVLECLAYIPGYADGASNGKRNSYVLCNSPQSSVEGFYILF